MNTLIFNGCRLVQSLSLIALTVFTVMAQPAPDYEWLDRPARFAPEEGIALWHQYPEEERLRLYFPAVQLKMIEENPDDLKVDYTESVEDIVHQLRESWRFLLESLHAYRENDLFDLANTLHDLVAPDCGIKKEHKDLVKILRSSFWLNLDSLDELCNLMGSINHLHLLLSPKSNDYMSFLFSVDSENIGVTCNSIDFVKAVVIKIRGCLSCSTAQQLNSSTAQQLNSSTAQQLNSSTDYPVVDDFVSRLYQIHLETKKTIYFGIKGLNSGKMKMQLFRIFLKNSLELLSQSTTNKEIVKNISYLTKAFVILHPYENGNGRTARMLMNYLLMVFGMPPPTLEFNAPIFLTDNQYKLQLFESIHLSYQLILNGSEVKRPIHALDRLPKIGRVKK